VTLFRSFASLGGLLFGYDQGVIANVLTNSDFDARFQLSPVEVGVLSTSVALPTYSSKKG
jgi:hypothetical protein